LPTVAIQRGPFEDDPTGWVCCGGIEEGNDERDQEGRRREPRRLHEASLPVMKFLFDQKTLGVNFTLNTFLSYRVAIFTKTAQKMSTVVISATSEFAIKARAHLDF